MPAKTRMFLSALIVFTMVFTSCKENTPGKTFDHSVSASAKPWNHDGFDDRADKFTFAIFSDLTGGERPGIFDVAVAQLNLLRPEFIVNVGDLIEGSTRDSLEWHRQWDVFDARVDKSIAPIFLTGGNHDLTGSLAQSIWQQRYGRTYYYFIYKDVMFMVLDTEDYAPEFMDYVEKIRLEAIKIEDEQGEEAYSKTAYANLPEREFGNIGEGQRDYFIKAIKDNPEVRHAFLFFHKPIWKKQDEENFQAIEESLSNMPYTVFHGHTHHYRYSERKGRDYINLATTGGVHFEGPGWYADHVTLVTVDGGEASIANILLEGILDKTGNIPLNGDTLSFGER